MSENSTVARVAADSPLALQERNGDTAAPAGAIRDVGPRAERTAESGSIRWFDELSVQDAEIAGGKGANLGN